MSTTNQTKVCAKCGKELPLSSFYTNNQSNDGRGDVCRSCLLTRGTRTAGCNPALASFQPRELIAELRARGYKGKLQIVQEINV